MHDWTPNPHPLERRIPDAAKAWIANGGSLDTKNDQGHVIHNNNATMAFLGSDVIVAYQLKK